MGKYGQYSGMKDKMQKGIGEKSKDYNDPREWRLQRDEQDNGTAVIRLLPGKGGDSVGIVRIYEHSIKQYHQPSNKYRWYIETSPASIGEECPASEAWFELGEINTEESKKLQKRITRSVKFVSNILVVNDPANPANNGKVFYWKYGVKLLNKFNAALEPTDIQLKEDIKAVELFDPEEGANIILDARKEDGFVTYDFSSISPSLSNAFATEEEMDDAVLNKCIDLNEFISPEYYKPYAELKKYLSWVLDKSDIEATLVENGSKVISGTYSDVYGKGSKNAKTEESYAKSDSASIKTKTYTPKKKAPETTEAPKTAEAPKTEAPVANTQVSEDDADILAMIDGL